LSRPSHFHRTFIEAIKTPSLCPTRSLQILFQRGSRASLIQHQERLAPRSYNLALYRLLVGVTLRWMMMMMMMMMMSLG